MADKSGATNNVTAVVIVIIFLIIVLGMFFYFGKRRSSTIQKPDFTIETPSIPSPLHPLPKTTDNQ